MGNDFIEYLGYSASIFVVLSFMSKDIHKIRIINLIGCFLFIGYGILKGMLWPIIIPNVFLGSIQFYYVFIYIRKVMNTNGKKNN